MQARISLEEQIPASIDHRTHLETLRREAMQRDAEKWLKERIEVLTKAIPYRFQGKTWDDFNLDHPEQIKCKQIAEKYVENFQQCLQEGTCLKFLGSSGTGKTLLSLIMYKALAEAGFVVRYESSTHFLRVFQEKEFESHAAYKSLLDFYLRIQCLVIDEVSVGNGKGGYLADWQKGHLYTLINQRYLNRLCTIIISNHTEKELIERVGEPTVGRLSEQGITLAFNWFSYRQK